VDLCNRCRRFPVFLECAALVCRAMHSRSDPASPGRMRSPSKHISTAAILACAVYLRRGADAGAWDAIPTSEHTMPPRLSIRPVAQFFAGWIARCREA
jgi:hypothetical protein